MRAFIFACLSTAAAAQERAGPAPSPPGAIASQQTDAQEWTESGHWRLNLAPYARHFRYNADHRYVWAIALERQTNEHWLAGASYFRNSFGQPSAYLYVGRRYPALFGQPPLFGQITGGMLYGYRGPFQHKVPLNYRGFSPGAVFSLGWQFNKNTSATVHLLGDAALMFQIGHDFR